MEAFEAYTTYIALKNHFTSKTYDFFKYRGRTKASRNTFDKRRDKYFFHKLSKRKDVIDYLVANFVYSNRLAWVGDLLNTDAADQNYLKFVKARESLTYIFREDLGKLDPEFNLNFTCKDSQHPRLLRLYLQGQVCIETLVILEDLISFSRKWSHRIEEKIIWPQVNQLCKKYKPFMQYDRNKMKMIVLDIFSHKDYNINSQVHHV